MCLRLGPQGPCLQEPLFRSWDGEEFGVSLSIEPPLWLPISSLDPVGEGRFPGSWALSLEPWAGLGGGQVASWGGASQ